MKHLRHPSFCSIEDNDLEPSSSGWNFNFFCSMDQSPFTQLFYREVTHKLATVWAKVVIRQQNE